jgi:hypothetical protein
VNRQRNIGKKTFVVLEDFEVKNKNGILGLN